MEPRTLEEQLEDALKEVDRLHEELEKQEQVMANYNLGSDLAKVVEPVLKGMTDNGLSRNEAMQIILRIMPIPLPSLF